MWGFSVSTALSEHEARQRLVSSVHRLDAILVLVEHHDPALRPLLEGLRQDAPGARLILQIAICNQDELETPLLACADLIITADMPSDTILRQLRNLLA